MLEILLASLFFIILLMTIILLGISLWVSSNKIKELKANIKTIRDTFDFIEKDTDARLNQLIRSNIENEAKVVHLENRLANDHEQYVLKLENLKEKHKLDLIEKERTVRKDATTRSKNVSHGFESEYFAPLLLADCLNPKDFRHLGDPIDYIVFNTMVETPNEHIEEVIFLEVKTGNSDLSTIQRRIRNAIIKGLVSFWIYNPDKQEIKEYKNGQSKPTVIQLSTNESKEDK